MKNLFKKAHELTKEMVKEYKDVDYQAQFGLFVSYLIEEEKEMKLIKKVKNTSEFSQRDQQITLADGRLGQWLAIIEGFDPKYEYARDFLTEDEIVRNIYCYDVVEGFIYNWSEGKEQNFGIVENGELFEISEQDVKNILNNGGM